MLKTIGRSIGAVLALLCVGCSQDPEESWETGAVEGEDLAGEVGVPIPAGPVADSEILYELAVYSLPGSTVDLSAVLEEELKETEFARLEEPDFEKKFVTATLFRNPQVDYPQPDFETLQNFEVGLSEKESSGLPKAEQVLVLGFGYPASEAWGGIRQSAALVHQVALRAGGVIWDQECRQAFSTAAWAERRLSDPESTGPVDLRKHVNFHSYPEGEFFRLISLGMAKFGLPDVKVEDSSMAMTNSVEALANAFIQMLGEAGEVAQEGRFLVDLEKIKHPKVRADLLGGLKENATRREAVSISRGLRDEGDPENRIFEIGFDFHDGASVQARQRAMLGGLLGSSDSKQPD